MTDARIVDDVYDIDEDLIHIKKSGPGGDYWKTVEKFWTDVKSKQHDQTTERQRNWLNKIEKQLNQETSR